VGVVVNDDNTGRSCEGITVTVQLEPDGASLTFLPPLAGEGQDGGERFCSRPDYAPSLTLPRAARKGGNP